MDDLTARFEHQICADDRRLLLVSSGLCRKLCIRPESPRNWSDQFAEVTLRYPSLQSEKRPVSIAQVREADLAHLCFLIHTFAEDRLLDRQAIFDRSEFLFVKQLCVEGMSILQGLAAGCGAFVRTQLVQSRRYSRAQTEEYDTHAGGESKFERSTILRIAAGRAAYGILAPVALLMAGGATEKQIRIAVNAFDCLVTGMQYVDDLKDWQEDLRTGDENLLLVALRQSGRNPYSHPANDVREANVGHALLEIGAVAAAASAAKRWFAAALRRQEMLGCQELAELIRQRIQAVDPLATSIETAIGAGLEATAARLGLNSFSRT